MLDVLYVFFKLAYSLCGKIRQSAWIISFFLSPLLYFFLIIHQGKESHFVSAQGLVEVNICSWAKTEE